MPQGWTAAAALAMCAQSLHAQTPCAHWSQEFRAPTADGIVATAVTWNADGSGESLYVAGRFLAIGDTIARNVARFDGAHWSPLGPGLGTSNTNTGVEFLTVYDDGSGPKLYAAGHFSSAGTTAVQNVARWDGSTWTAVGHGLINPVYSLAAFDTGSGPRLFALGEAEFESWDGTSWSPVAMSGLNGGQALLAFDDGAGSALYVGAGPAVYRYDGQTTTQVGGSLAGNVVTLAAYDDGSGSGETLFAGTQNFAPGVVRWDGSSWNPVGGGLNDGVNSLAVIDPGDGSGSQLYAGGRFTNAGGVDANKTARWNGTSWTALAPTTPLSDVVLMASFGHTVLAGSSIFDTTLFGGAGLLRWNGTNWTPMLAGNGLVPHDLAYTALALAVFDPGTGPELFVGGHNLDAIPDTANAAVTHWNGARWSTCGIPIPSLHVDIAPLGVADTGSGNRLYASSGGNLVVWNGATSWSIVPGSQQHLGVGTMIGFDDGTGPKLWAGGGVLLGGVVDARISTWDGSTWQDIATGDPQSDVLALAKFDDGTGLHLYAAGDFNTLHGMTVHRIAERVGANWAMLGNGVDDGEVKTMVEFDDGSGPALYVGGNFTSVSGIPACGIARWNGSTWSSVGNPGTPGTFVPSLCVHDDGTGPALYAAGPFTSIGGVAANYIARWNGSTWMPLDAGMNDVVSAIASYDAHTGDGPALYACGRFTSAGSVTSVHIAKWTCSSDTGVAYCFGDLTHVGSTPCPCGNFGATGHGCANSFESAGARLLASGSPGVNPTTGTDTVVLSVTNLPPTTMVLFLKGSSAIGSGVVLGDGLRCIAGSLIRLATKAAVAGHAQYPESGDLPLSQRGQTPIGSLQTGYYQAYYRNVASFCTSAPFNLSNGVAITWSY